MKDKRSVNILLMLLTDCNRSQGFSKTSSMRTAYLRNEKLQSIFTHKFSNSAVISI